MTKVRLLTALSLGTMLFASCEKEAEENIAPQSATQSSAVSAALPGTWQLTAFRSVASTSSTSNGVVTDIFTLLDECKKDDKLQFEATGVLSELPGAIQCLGDEENPVKPGSWTLSDDQKTLTLNQDLEETKLYQVVSLTASTLKLRTVAEPNQSYTEVEYTR